LRIPNLELKDYVVRVSKSGFQEAPDQRIRIRKGEQGKLIFSLQSIPHFASLTIQGGVPGATVLIDQAAVGTVQPDGTLTVATVNPGDHMVELRKDGFKPKQSRRSFVAGAAVSLANADVTLETALAELRITFTPAEAQVSLGKAGETPTKVSSGSTLGLSAGSYTLTAKIADFTRSSTVEVPAGQSRSLDLSLGPSGMSRWNDPAGWKPENGSFVHKGGDFVMYNLSPSSGTFVFSAMLSKGRRLQWMLDCVDANNCVLFQMDENNFYRTVVRNGAKGDEIKIPHKGDKKSFRTLQIHVGANEITHQIKQGENWVLLDRWTQPGGNLGLGRFGFYIPGNDQVALSSFAHYVDLATR
jgi:PEGA domain